MKNLLSNFSKEKFKKNKKKNMISFFKKPLIYWTLKMPLISKSLIKIILSSDWEKLLRYSKINLKNNTLDKSKTICKIKHYFRDCYKIIIKKFKITNGIYFILQPTSPL